MSDWPVEYLPSVDKFLAEENGVRGEADHDERAFKSEWLFPLQRKGELAQMVRIARAMHSGAGPKTLLEIGADKGAGIYQWVKCLATLEVVIAIEPRGCPYGNALARAFPHVEFGLMDAGSHEPNVVEFIKENLNGRRIDVLFIDGDKLATERDFNLYLPLMSPGGIIFVHDIIDDPPALAWRTLRYRGKSFAVILNRDDYEASLDREKRGIFPSCPHEGWLRHWKGQSCGVGVIYLP
jgi:hypothetical protein